MDDVRGVHHTAPTVRDDAVVDALEELSFDCPRCGAPASGVHYGPCGGCVEQLRASVSADARDVDGPTYEPKVNVTPNAVALKD